MKGSFGARMGVVIAAGLAVLCCAGPLLLFGAFSAAGAVALALLRTPAATAGAAITLVVVFVAAAMLAKRWSGERRSRAYRGGPQG
jgi:membrane protein implicated in regulation of membrane protease activity